MRHTVALLLSLAAALSAADDSAATATAAKLLEAMKAGELATQTMEAGFQQGVKPFIDQAPAEQRPAIEKGMQAASEFLRSKVTWDVLKDDYVALYAASFTAQELEQLLAFYQSPLGRRLVEQTPGLTTKSMELSGARMQKLMPDLQRIVVETITKAQSETKATSYAELGLVMGKPFPELVLKTTDGGTLNTRDLKGKVVLVDYWATWCGPCVREIPTMLATYERFHAQGFEVVGISLDEDTAACAAFVAEKKLPWKQSCDGKGWQGDAAQRFAVDSIPATFLIAKDGTLAAVDLRGEALTAAVETALSVP